MFETSDKKIIRNNDLNAMDEIENAQSGSLDNSHGTNLSEAVHSSDEATHCAQMGDEYIAKMLKLYNTMPEKYNDYIQKMSDDEYKHFVSRSNEYKIKHGENVCKNVLIERNAVSGEIEEASDEYTNQSLDKLKRDLYAYRDIVLGNSSAEFDRFIDKEASYITEHKKVQAMQNTADFIADMQKGITSEPYDYISDTYNIDIDSMSDKELVYYLQNLYYTDVDAYIDIMGNMSDEDFERFTTMLNVLIRDGTF